MKLQSLILMLLTFLNELCQKIENTLGSMLQTNVVLIAVPVHEPSSVSRPYCIRVPRYNTENVIRVPRYNTENVILCCAVQKSPRILGEI